MLDARCSLVRSELKLDAGIEGVFGLNGRRCTVSGPEKEYFLLEI